MTPISALLLPFLGVAVILISARDLHKRNYVDVDCGPDKEYNSCGSACPPNCTHLNGVPCNRRCNPGCFCKDGYVELGEFCVEKEKCED
ncbi:chymotrypsin inhibitor-like [Ranitomeya imitator]|uniref:chymotrypsin inhibitor-like n=1 Tax=Ranitomeya imitator TaxID=111125 RepID=UPI0037E88ED9